MGLKKIIMGEPMPDKNDPKYKERYEREVEAGKQFADKSGLSWLAMKIQTVANHHRVGFLVTVFGIMIYMLKTARLSPAGFQTYPPKK